MKSLIKFITNTIVIVVLIIALIVGYNWYQRRQGKVAYLFNYATFAVKGDSMRPTIESGDLLIIHKEKDYKVGDIITFANDKKEIVTHRIMEITPEKEYLTKGDNNLFEDENTVDDSKVYGKVIYDFTQYDEVLNFLNTYKWFLIIGFIILSVVGRLLL